ncbi:MAG TPA: GDP-mannose 4,6-dehydratase [Thermoanaerobaculia bacterium]|nr:GDP-mannose 4,6-dehydratase [Thermoanaerobaculia bacterium]
MARVLITGVTGQDGSYLSESHLATGDEVHGMVRQSSLLQRTRLDAIPALERAKSDGRLFLHFADLQDTSSLVALMRKVRPDVVYHLAGQSHVGISFDMPEYTAEATGLGTLRLLEAVRQVAPECRFFFAATSEIFGEPLEVPQSEKTPMAPINPYAAAKVYALNLVRIYRKAYGLHASVGILFNHESPRRGENYVTRKVAGAAARIARGLQTELHLGTLEPKRDWSYALDTVAGMRKIVDADCGDDYILASGVTHSVREFCEAAFRHVGLDYTKHVVLDPNFKRPVDISETRGDPSKARRELAWVPTTGFDELVRIMVDAELAAIDGRGEHA